MWKFGAGWQEENTEEEKPHERTVTFKDPARFRPPPWCKWISVGFAATVALLLLIAVMGSAGSTAEEELSGKVLLILLEGMKGTTFQTAAMESNRAPNIKAALRTYHGVYAQCLSPSDTRCARTQSGAKLGGPFTWGSAPGLASILTGVDVDKHGVANDTMMQMTRLRESSVKYPTIFSVARRAGLRTAAIGSSHLLTTVGENGQCTNLGILDFECADDAVTHCLQDSSCNANRRLSLSTPVYGSDASRAVLDSFRELLKGDYDLIAVHFNQLARIVALGDAEYSATSDAYVAQLYLIDSVIGQMMALIKGRVSETLAPWLVVGTSDHGGMGQTFGKNPVDDEIVPFFMIPFVAGSNLRLAPLRYPTHNYDAAPTILSWLGLLTPEYGASLDGLAQSVCTLENSPRNCTDEDVIASSL